MARKRALVVDDSKSARVILSRMLEKYDIEVDMAESAERAIAYLERNRPDAIFMDHLMPGMDGLQALRAIKGNPHTATIPIMMYTSQEGELYVGQARALGAMGVLPKQVRPVDVSKVLYELHLLPDRRDATVPVLMPTEFDGATPVERLPAAASTPASTPAPAFAAEAARAGAPDWTRRVEIAVKDQGADLRRFIVASLDSFAMRVVGDLRDAMPSAPAAIAPPPPPPKPVVWPWVLVSTTLLLSTVVCAAFWVVTRDELVNSRGRITALSAANADLQRSRADLAVSVKELTAAVAAGSAATSAGGAALPVRIELVPYGEIPFDRSRLEALRDFLAKFETQGFHGTVKVTSFAGVFCLSGNAVDGFVPASAGLPAGRCDLLGNPFEESLTGQQRQSLAFANLVASVRQRTAGSIMLLIDSAGTSRPAAPYPPRSEQLTAGDWNRIAGANNRVEFTAEAN